MGYNLGTASGRIDLNYTGAPAVKRAQTDLGRLTGSMRAAGISAGTLGKLATVGIGGAVAAGFAVAVGAAVKFEKQMSAIEAVSGATGAEMDGMRAKALQLGADTAFSASEAAMAMEELVKAGLSVEEVLNGAADAAVSLAAAGGIGLAEAATIASNAMNQFNLSAQELPGVVDLIAGAANASAIDVTDLGQSLTQVGAVAYLAGASFKDVATAIALMGNAGIRGSDAGTSLKTMFQNLQPVTTKQIALFKGLGIVTEDGTNNFFDATGAVKSYAGISEVLAKALKGKTNAEKLSTLETMFGTDAIRAAAVAADAGAKGVRDLAKDMGKLTAAEVAAKRMDNLSGSFEELKGSIETALIIAGSSSLGVLRSLVDGLTDGVNSATKFGQELAGDVAPGMESLAGAAENVWDILTNLWGLIDGGGGPSALNDALGLTVDLFNVVAGAIETVTGLIEGQEAALLIAVGTWLLLANGGIAVVAARLGWFAAYAVVQALGGLVTLQAGVAATSVSLAGLGAAALAASASLGAVALLVAAVMIWKAYSDAVNDTAKALESARQARESGSVVSIKEEIDTLKKTIEERKKLIDDYAVDNIGDTGRLLNNAFNPTRWDDVAKIEEYRDSLGDLNSEAEGLAGEMDRLALSLTALAVQAGALDATEARELLMAFQDGDPQALADVEQLFTTLGPLMAKAGYTAQEFKDALTGTGDVSFHDLINGVKEVKASSDGAADAQQSLTEAAKDFSDATLDAAAKAKGLKAALDALIGVELSAAQASINWRDGMRSLVEQIKSTNGQIRGGTAAADANKSAIIDQVNKTLDVIDANARAGDSLESLGKTFKKQRAELIRQAVAAGVNEEAMKDLLKQYKFTPKDVRTFIQAVQVDEAKEKMKKLINQYDLTPEQVKTIVKEDGATTVKEKLAAIKNYIRDIDGDSATVTVTTNFRRTGSGQGQKDAPMADGGLVNYARGGLHRKTYAGIYGAQRIKFAEPETGGEAFIPLSRNRRYRSEAIIAKVAQIFGGQFVKMADGGFTNLASGIANSRSAISQATSTTATIVIPPQNGGGLRIVDGKLRIDERGNAWIRGLAQEVSESDSQFDSVRDRMGSRG